jgi:hypothetical protein
MAAIAAHTVETMRVRFRTLEDVNRFFAERISQDGFPVYRAAITAGLVGDIETARKLFERMERIDLTNWGSWITKLTSECTTLAALLDDPDHYKAALLETITNRREKMRLPPDPKCLESTGSTVVR